MSSSISVSNQPEILTNSNNSNQFSFSQIAYGYLWPEMFYSHLFKKDLESLGSQDRIYVESRHDFKGHILRHFVFLPKRQGVRQGLSYTQKRGRERQSSIQREPVKLVTREMKDMHSGLLSVCVEDTHIGK